MNDLIYRQAVLDYPIRLDHYDEEHGNRHFVLGIESVMEYVEHLPSVEPCNKDAISREGLLKSWEELSPRGRTEFDQVIMTIPALPSTDRPTGEWIKKVLLKDTVYDLHVYKCSCCGVWGKLKFNYCPNCGAKMGGD